MDETRFWNIVETSFGGGGAQPAHLGRLRRALKALPRAEVVGFQRVLRAQMARAYRWDLIAAACFVGAGQSDDGFEDFRAWLISRGRRVFEQVLRDPSAIAELPFHASPIEEWNGEDFHMLPGEVADYESDPAWPFTADPKKPLGERIPLERKELLRRYPRLRKRFGTRFMII